MLTTSQAARMLKIGVRQVQALIKSGRLHAVRFGRDFQIQEKDLRAVRNRRGPGRPRKA